MYRVKCRIGEYVEQFKLQNACYQTSIAMGKCFIKMLIAAYGLWISSWIRMDPSGFVSISVDFLARFLLQSMLHGKSSWEIHVTWIEVEI